MSKRKVWFLILGGIILLIAGALVGWLKMFGRLPWQSGKYADPQGRFSMNVDSSWEQVKADGSYTQFKIPEPPMHINVLVLKSGTIKDAFYQAFMIAGFDPGLLTGAKVVSIGDWQASNIDDATGLHYGLAGQIVGENTYVVMVKAYKPDIDKENPPVMRAGSRWPNPRRFVKYGNPVACLLLVDFASLAENPAENYEALNAQVVVLTGLEDLTISIPGGWVKTSAGGWVSIATDGEKMWKEDIAPFALRVTMIFRPEDGVWKIVHRHADPIVTNQPIESITQK